MCVCARARRTPQSTLKCCASTRVHNLATPALHSKARVPLFGGKAASSPRCKGRTRNQSRRKAQQAPSTKQARQRPNGVLHGPPAGEVGGEHNSVQGRKWINSLHLRKNDFIGLKSFFSDNKTKVAAPSPHHHPAVPSLDSGEPRVCLRPARMCTVCTATGGQRDGCVVATCAPSSVPRATIHGSPR